ncbi:MAG: 2-amino-4-hydroxy-6-hydroxymethyldihydropteridine diphosphokinase [Pirellulales bacterium]
MADCLVALGANLGERRQTLERAVAELGAAADVQVVAVSRWHETAPVGGPAGQPPFLNGAVRIETGLSPNAVVELLLAIERKLGRRRDQRWGARQVDLDLLLYDQQIVETEAVSVPHPRMAFRRFVLEPAAEIAGDMPHPRLNWTIGQLLAHLDHSPYYVAIAGLPGLDTMSLAEHLCGRFGGRLLRDPADDEASPADLSGPAYQRAIRFLQQRAAPLAAAAWPAEDQSQRLVVSDYWLDQARVSASIELKPGEWTEFERAWQAAIENVVRPRLIVAMDAPVAELQAALTAAGDTSWTAEQLQRLCWALAEWIDQGGHGPVLRLATGNWEEIRREVEAAVAAAR